MHVTSVTIITKSTKSEGRLIIALPQYIAARFAGLVKLVVDEKESVILSCTEHHFAARSEYIQLQAGFVYAYIANVCCV